MRNNRTNNFEYKFYSANYSYTNHNFVIQNLEGKRLESSYISLVCILKNILQRGLPTLMSSFLQGEIGSIHKNIDFNEFHPLIATEPPKWNRMIRGDERNNNNPAKRFFEKIIPKYLGDYKFIHQLILPEVLIEDIIKSENNRFKNQQVDFYLPQAFLIIEIDGYHHDNIEKFNDRERDEYTKKNRIKTIRITTKDLNEENEIFISKIEEIKMRIKKFIEMEEKPRDVVFNCLGDYKKAWERGIDLENPYYIATGIMRFQLLILELLEVGKLELGSHWYFQLISEDFEFNKKALTLAIEDLSIWIQHLAQLQKIEYKRVQFTIKCVSDKEHFSFEKGIINIDFSISKRYTDENILYPNVIFVRNDYLDKYLYFKKGNSRKDIKGKLKILDHFKLSTCSLVEYKLQLGKESKDEEALKFLLWNLFLQTQEGLDFGKVEFREGQLPIIANSLKRNDTIGLLPTGSGKSVCYQLSAILQPGISFVVCPIKSLMYDQKSDLEKAFFTRINLINSDLTPEEKEEVQSDFKNGKYQFIFISPERFQVKEFRNYLTSINCEFEIAYAVIDEVHCLSEWGHDFRISYLNLAYAIKKYSPKSKILGLTATASINVLKDIQIEFNIEDINVKTLQNYTRKELEFNVITTSTDKYKVLKKQLLQNKGGNSSKCGIIFTPYVNGNLGCYDLFKKINADEDILENVSYYSGSKPKKEKIEESKFNDKKKQIQEDFKENKISLLTATKAFGMGINKENIYYTFHYGIPNSLEAFYQEAGRAGRGKRLFNKEKALCTILLTQSINKNYLEEVWAKDTFYQDFLIKVEDSQGETIEEKLTLKYGEKKEHEKEGYNIKYGLLDKTSGDVNTQLYLFLQGMNSLKDEYIEIRKNHNEFSKKGETDIVIPYGGNKNSKIKLEKIIYKLKQLGIVEDWTVNFRDELLEVSYNDYSEETVKQTLEQTIQKYDKEFSFENMSKNEKYLEYNKTFNSERASIIEKCIYTLLQWSYNNVTYTRKQSLKTMYELACKVADKKISNVEFKKEIEGYFKISLSTHSFDQIAENPSDYLEWFKVFYKKKSNTINESLIELEEQKELITTLNRFLESYMENTGLDLISGILRLMVGEYENSDGYLRLESSLKKIKSYDNEIKKQEILAEIFKIGKKLTLEKRNKLVESIYKSFNEIFILERCYKELKDTYSVIKYIEVKGYKKRLKKVEETIA